MTILQGTMSDGTLVPIQADSQGRLVAEGLPGPEGPQGPPGVGQLPPNPQNGDVLAWDNGLIWVSGIIPAARPQTDVITNVDTSGAQPVLTFASNKDLADFAAGDAIEQENATGTPIYSQGYNITSGNLHSTLGVLANAFDGNYAETYAQPYTGAMFVGPADPRYTIDFPNISASTVTVYFVVGNNWSFNLQINGSGETQRVPASGDTGTIGGEVFKITYNNLTELNKLEFLPILSGSGSVCGITAVLVDGVVLVDGTGIEPRGTVGSVDTVANTMTLATSTGTWGPANAGHYVLGPAVARYTSALQPHL